MKVIDLDEAKAYLEEYARECRSSPAVVTVDGRLAFEMIPVRSDDPVFFVRLLTANPDFRRLMEERRPESESGRGSSPVSVRDRFDEPTDPHPAGFAGT